MKVKHLLCGIVVVILILYIFKILFYRGNGFNVGGQLGVEQCSQIPRSKRTDIGGGEFLCIADCDECAGIDCNSSCSASNTCKDGKCKCDPKFTGSNCEKCNNASMSIATCCTCLSASEISKDPTRMCALLSGSECCNKEHSGKQYCSVDSSTGKCIANHPQCSELNSASECNTDKYPECKWCPNQKCGGKDGGVCNASNTKCPELYPDPCEKSPCNSSENTCIRSGSLSCSYTCSCTPRWSGSNCKEEVWWEGTNFSPNVEGTSSIPTYCTKDKDCTTNLNDAYCDLQTHRCSLFCGIRDGDNPCYYTIGNRKGIFDGKLKGKEGETYYRAPCVSTDDPKYPNKGICPFGTVSNYERAVLNPNAKLENEDCRHRLCDPIKYGGQQGNKDYTNCSFVNGSSTDNFAKLVKLNMGTLENDIMGCPSIPFYEYSSNPSKDCKIKQHDVKNTNWCCSPSPSTPAPPPLSHWSNTSNNKFGL